MKIKNRILCSFLAMLLLVSLAACGKKEQGLNIVEDNYRNYYEIFVGSFYDSNEDGCGDIGGVIKQLDYVKDLGFNGIWLMPIMPSETYHKYDVKDYYDIDSAYGTMEDMELLIEECHKRDIRLIIDFVFNHTSAKHPWFLEAAEYLQKLPEGEEADIEECPYVDYYYFSRESKGSGWQQLGTSEWFYECVFWDQMPDLNLDSDAVREELEKAAAFWLEKGIDGFRLDAAKEFFTGQPEKNIEVLRWFSEYVKSIAPDAYLVGEVWESSVYIAQYYESGIDSLFNFPMAEYDGRIATTAKSIEGTSGLSYTESLVSFDEKYRASNPDYIDAPFISNHDTSRVASQLVSQEGSMKYAAGLLLTQNGSPFVYYGEEIGMSSKGKKDENKRLSMYWSAANQEGMTNDPADADVVEHKFPSLEEQKEDPLSIYNYYKKALRIRNTYPEIARGTMQPVTGIETPLVSAMKKEWEGEWIGLVYNSSKEAISISLEQLGMEEGKLVEYLTVDEAVVNATDGVLEMPPLSIAYIK